MADGLVPHIDHNHRQPPGRQARAPQHKACSYLVLILAKPLDLFRGTALLDAASAFFLRIFPAATGRCADLIRSCISFSLSAPPASRNNQNAGDVCAVTAYESCRELRVDTKRRIPLPNLHLLHSDLYYRVRIQMAKHAALPLGYQVRLNTCNQNRKP